MKRTSAIHLLLAAGLSCALIHTSSADWHHGSVRIAGGEFTPQYGPGGSKLPVKVKPFSLDQTPVTRQQYRDFVRANPKWKKGQVPSIFAEENYLKDWKGDHYPKGTGQYPVGQVSYFAAAAYCEWRGGRLPSVMEWEFAAQAANPAEGEEILNAVSSPSGPRAVGQGRANRYGLQDLHGMIWEWTMDYNSSFVTSDNRQDGEMTKNFFCGSSSVGAADRLNYPAFIRYAMRGGLRPDFTLVNLGFRCAYE